MQTLQRKYQETHPWITFKCDTTSFSHELWMNLGEARSKCEHIAGVPLQPEIAQDLHEVYLAKGVFATTAIEGNTLSEKQVRQHLEGSLKLPPSQEYLGRELDNIVSAVNLIAQETLSSDHTNINPEEIKEYNRKVLDGLKLEEWIVPGEIRDDSVTAGRYLGAPPEDCEYLLERMCDWLNDPAFCPSDGDNRLVFGILRAIMAHLYLAWIHPFGDGNGRTARLVEFKILFAAGFPTPAAHLLSNHYNFTRTEYYRQLDQASRSGGETTPFVDYAVEGLIDGLKEQLARIKLEQWEIAWRDYVYGLFSDKDQHKESVADKRQRHLILDLSEIKQSDWINLNELESLTPRVAKDYAVVKRKTMLRDLRSLASMGLVEVKRNEARAKPEIILAFLPHRRDPESLASELTDGVDGG